MFGDVNISAILDSFSYNYDKRVRPNYGGEFRCKYDDKCKKRVARERATPDVE